MKTFFKPNIDVPGRWLRIAWALLLFVGAWWGFGMATWLGIALLVLGLFALLEAFRGWCVLRACGIKTRW